MRIILSRKSVDSASGGMASPILPCGCLCPIPIPYKHGVRYSDVRFGKRSLDQVCGELPGWKNHFAHVDPDLRFESRTPGRRLKGWWPAFGQSSASASHLNNQGVGKGDLFVFFGWFRRTERASGGELQFCPNDKHGRHIIYGWLEVGEIFPVDGRRLPNQLQFLRDHPHVKFAGFENSPNQIYVASRSGLGAGLFATENPDLVLTKPNCKRSLWQLPAVFESVRRQRDLTYHGKKERWGRDGRKICLRTVARGQEFVLDCTRHPAVYQYFSSLIASTPKVSATCSHDVSPKRILGSAKGEFTIPEDFNDPLPKEIENLFW